MLAAVLLAASLPLGVWPSDAGPAARVVDDVEFYLVEPEDDYVIVAVQALAAPLTKAEPATLRHLTVLAHRLGADGVLLLAGLAEKEIPEDNDEPLPQGKTFVAAVFIAFDVDVGEEGGTRQAVYHARRGRRSLSPRFTAPGTGSSCPVTVTRASSIRLPGR
jgi:hypothetical protein